MALEPYTPDPVAGAATDALGVINRFNDQEPVRSLIANFPDEQIIDWVAYLKGRLVAAEVAIAFLSLNQTIDPLVVNGDIDPATAPFWSSTGTALTQIWSALTVGVPDGTDLRVAAYTIAQGSSFELRRKSSSTIVRFDGPSATPADNWGACHIRMVSGEWRLISAISGAPLVIGVP